MQNTQIDHCGSSHVCCYLFLFNIDWQNKPKRKVLQGLSGFYKKQSARSSSFTGIKCLHLIILICLKSHPMTLIHFINQNYGTRIIIGKQIVGKQIFFFWNHAFSECCYFIFQMFNWYVSFLFPLLSLFISIFVPRFLLFYCSMIRALAWL